MFREFVSESSSPGSSPCRGHCVAHVLGQDTYLIVLLSTQVYEWVMANLMQGVSLRLTSIQTRGE